MLTEHWEINQYIKNKPVRIFSQTINKTTWEISYILKENWVNITPKNIINIPQLHTFIWTYFEEYIANIFWWDIYWKKEQYVPDVIIKWEWGNIKWYIEVKSVQPSCWTMLKKSQLERHYNYDWNIYYALVFHNTTAPKKIWEQENWKQNLLNQLKAKSVYIVDINALYDYLIESWLKWQTRKDSAEQHLELSNTNCKKMFDDYLWNKEKRIIESPVDWTDFYMIWWEELV